MDYHILVICELPSIRFPTADVDRRSTAVTDRGHPPGSVGLKAEGNWWGSDSPNSCWFTLVDYSPWLNSDPLAKRAPQFIAQASVPRAFTVEGNYPNPFNSSTVITFSLSELARTRVEIFNILGHRVRKLVDGDLPPGRHQIAWDGTDGRGRSLASGVYLYRVVTAGGMESRKMVLLK